MNTLLRGLSDRGLVERAETAPTGRALPTTLTSEGKRLLARAIELVETVQTRMVSTLTERQGRDLHRALTQCIDALSE